MKISIPDFCLVALVGASGSGKSTFAARYFKSTEVLSSDFFRGLVSDDENDQTATTDAFDALHHVAGIRLRRRQFVVVDATNVQKQARAPLLALARRHHCFAVALVLDVPARECERRNAGRTDRDFGKHVIPNQVSQLRKSLRDLKTEGFRYVHVLKAEDIDGLEIERTPLWTDRRHESGPYDIIGDVHGCYDELTDLLSSLGYRADAAGSWSHAEGRRAVFLGDLVDRGPRVVDVVQLVRGMQAAGSALCVPGNHDLKLQRALKGNKVKVSHGLAQSLEQIEALPDAEREQFKRDYIEFTEQLVSHLWLDGGRLCVAHAGMKEDYIGRSSGAVRDFALYGDTTGETDEFGLPVRYPWAEEYRGKASVVYGHTPVPVAEWLNNTVNVDTGCVFGGSLTALRWPEREVVSVPARATYADPIRPIAMASPAGGALQWQHDELLHAKDVLGRRHVQTQWAHRVSVPEDHAAAALEIMSRFAAEPRWLIYLPPTMSPCETAPDGDCLERPKEAFEYFRQSGVSAVICERKHMGSRAVVVVCRDDEVAQRRFGASGALSAGLMGQCYTRTGRPFFDDEELHRLFLAEVSRAVGGAGLWDELGTDWLCLDCELMPWNAKAQGLLREQYAPVAVAGTLSLERAVAAARSAAQRGVPVDNLLASLESRAADVRGYQAAYGQYCWSVDGLKHLRLAPFHVLASEGRTYFDRDHVWHMQTLAKLADVSELFEKTEWLTVDLADQASEQAAADWWLRMTAAGGEGMVVKPLSFVALHEGRLVQPAVKVRGREYLRIIYGPEYTEPQHLSRLRQRGLATKRSLAAREFALGAEALTRFVAREPLRRVHECVFAVLALESEPVDPRL
jgi:protein phosphatase